MTAYSKSTTRWELKSRAKADSLIANTANLCFIGCLNISSQFQPTFSPLKCSPYREGRGWLAGLDCSCLGVAFSGYQGSAPVGQRSSASRKNKLHLSQLFAAVSFSMVQTKMLSQTACWCDVVNMKTLLRPVILFVYVDVKIVTVQSPVNCALHCLVLY